VSLAASSAPTDALWRAPPQPASKAAIIVSAKPDSTTRDKGTIPREASAF
jgi:hypothetical protein